MIPITVLATLVAMKLLGMSFNLMTLGGIAAAIGLVIDDAIVVVESIATHVAAGRTPVQAVEATAREITGPLVGSLSRPHHNKWTVSTTLSYCGRRPQRGNRPVGRADLPADDIDPHIRRITMT